MKSMLFAAGVGSRLKPLTDSRPKALVRVGGKTLLTIAMNRLVAAGADEVVVNVHHFGEQIIKYVDDHDFGVPVHISDEREKLLDTGGGLRKALPLFSDPDAPVLLHNVDILSNADLAAFYDRAQYYDVTLLVSPRPSSRQLLFSEDMRLVGWKNMETGNVRTPYAHLEESKCMKMAFSGIHVISPRLKPMLDAFPEVFSIMDFYLACCHKIQIHGILKSDLQLLDVGKPETFAKAEEFLKSINN